MKPLALAIVLALAVPTVLPAQTPAPATPAAARPAQAWVTTSNADAMIMVKALAQFEPEQFSFFGIPGYDDKVSDLGPNGGERLRAALAQAKQQLNAKLQTERDPNVRQDLQIMIQAADRQSEGSALSDRLMLSWIDAPQLVFSGIQGLLSDQTPADRRAKALDRLKAYVGMASGTQPATELAKARYLEGTSNTALVHPTKLDVQQSLGNVDTYAAGIRKLFAKYKIEGADATLDAMDAQFKAYGAWAKTSVLPSARDSTVLPPEMYAFQLKGVGIDIDPQLLMQRAEVEFMETRAAMRQLAPVVAKAKNISGITDGDYIAVIRALKKDTIPNDQLEARYRTVIDRIDPIIRKERIVEVPNRPMVMRLGSEAESAAQPAPHFLPAPLVGNTGQQGQFVLPVSVPNPDGSALSYDDFNFESAAWTLSAHEGRPGHELQFTAMVERGISLARTLFAFNSVNVEGWALYAEAEMVPYEPVDGQMIALQLRLLRAARAILDPMLNLGLIDRARAGEILENDVGVSKAMAKQELDRYTFNSPGQAGSYFYGYSRILELRMQTEIALGKKFDRYAFNNFLLDQGLLPPSLLSSAVKERFVPEQKRK